MLDKAEEGYDLVVGWWCRAGAYRWGGPVLGDWEPSKVVVIYSGFLWMTLGCSIFSLPACGIVGSIHYILYGTRVDGLGSKEC